MAGDTLEANGRARRRAEEACTLDAQTQPEAAATDSRQLLRAAAADDGIEIFHAGTQSDGKKTTAHGGRVLAVTALGKSVAAAQSRAYKAVDTVDWPEGFCRRDIGYRAVAREKQSA